MLNKKGQALIEFVLILPIFLLLVFGIIDFALVINCKNNLENKVLEISTMIKDNISIEEIENFINEDNSYDIKVSIDEIDKGYRFSLVSSIELVTPGLELIIDNPYKVEVKHNVYK